MLLARQASGGGAGFRQAGDITDAGLAAQRVTLAPGSCTFSPDFTPGVSNIGGLAYALYRLNSTGYAGSLTLRCGWVAGQAPASGAVWIGLGQVARDRWQWASLPPANALPLAGGVTPYSAANGDMLVMLVATGTLPCALSYVRLGNEPPMASLVALPAASGPLPLNVTFDAGSSADSDGSLSTYEIDFGEGAGFGALAGTSTPHTYASMGTFNAQLRVTDNEGGVGLAQVQIDAGVVPNQPPTPVLVVVNGGGLPGTTATFDASGSSDADGTVTFYEFDPEGDGTYLPGSAFAFAAFTYSQPGTYNPTVRVTDDKGATATASHPVQISYGTLALKTLDNLAGGDYCNIGIANAKLCVAYKQGSQLAFVRATQPSGDFWFAPQLLASMGLGCSLASIKGNPAIAYASGGDQLNYMRANQPDGSTWASPQVVMSGATLIGVYPALATIGGFPAVTCSDATAFTSGVSWYARATNDTGTAWGARKQISAAGQNTACGSLLALSNGRPCAGVMRTSGFNVDQLQFVAATNGTGTSWNPPIPLVSTEGFIGASGGLALVGGLPAMAYYDLTAATMKFMRASDSAGLAWESPVSINGPHAGNSAISLALINGLPVVAFYDSANKLQLSIATDQVGTAWNPPLSVDPSLGDGLAYVSLTEFNSRPAIAYSCNSTGLFLAHWE